MKRSIRSSSPLCEQKRVLRREKERQTASLSSEYIKESDRVIIEKLLNLSLIHILNVYPAAGLINYYRGNKLALVNLSSTPYDDRADLVIHEKIGKVFSQL